MKTQAIRLCIILSLGMFLLGCNKDNEIIIDDGTGEEVVEMGTVSLNPSFKDVINITTGKPPTLEEVLELMGVAIRDDSSLVFSDSYNNIAGPIELLPGDYTLLISNYSDYFGIGQRFSSPDYGDVLSFQINAGENITLNPVLESFDVAATVNFTSGLLLAYPDISASVEFLTDTTSGPLTWTSIQNNQKGYFTCYSGDFGFGNFFGPYSSDLTIEISATGQSGLPTVITKTYPGAAANEHYNIVLELTESATISLTVTLADEIVINDTITFPN